MAATANDMSEILSTLNDLIETCKDSQEGFHSAAEKLKDQEIHSLFLRFYLQRAEFAGQLQAEVTRIGGDPATSGIYRRRDPSRMDRLENRARGRHRPRDSRRGRAQGKMPPGKTTSRRCARICLTIFKTMLSGQLHEIQQTHKTIRELLDKVHTTTDLPMAGLR